MDWVSLANLSPFFFKYVYAKPVMFESGSPFISMEFTDSGRVIPFFSVLEGESSGTMRLICTVLISFYKEKKKSQLSPLFRWLILQSCGVAQQDPGSTLPSNPLPGQCKPSVDLLPLLPALLEMIQQESLREHRLLSGLSGESQRE